jgi:general secretion pathway protein L
MSVLIVQLPPRPRRPGADAGSECAWVLSPDGQTVGASGRGAPADWPGATTVTALLDDADVSWRQATLPKAPPARLRQALAGLLEETLLDDDAALHFAVAPGAVAGKPAWIAVVHKPWLAATLARLEAAGRAIDRVLPASTPAGDGQAQGHFQRVQLADEHADDGLRLAWSDATGAGVVGLAGSLARERAAALGEAARFCATPAAAGAAEAWLGRPVAVLGEAERALEASRRGWNLRQFDLAPRHRGLRLLREAAQAVLAPAWRPVRVGLVVLAAVQLLGLNAYAWQQQRQVDARRAAMVALLRATHPQVRAVLDAPRQMARETEQLRIAAGQPGDDDLETMLAAAAAAWPDGRGPTTAIGFAPGRLELGIAGWRDADVAALREQLQPAGWSVAAQGGTLTLTRAAEARP